MITPHTFCILYVLKWKAPCINARWFNLLLRPGIIAWMHNVVVISLWQFNCYNKALGADSLSRLLPGFLQVRKLLFFFDYIEVFQCTAERDRNNASEKETGWVKVIQHVWSNPQYFIRGGFSQTNNNKKTPQKDKQKYFGMVFSLDHKILYIKLNLLIIAVYLSRQCSPHSFAAATPLTWKLCCYYCCCPTSNPYLHL